MAEEFAAVPFGPNRVAEAMSPMGTVGQHLAHSIGQRIRP